EPIRRALLAQGKLRGFEAARVEPLRYLDGIPRIRSKWQGGLGRNPGRGTCYGRWLRHKRYPQGIQIRIANHKCAFASLHMCEPCSVSSPGTDDQLMRCLIVRRSCERKNELRFFQAILGLRCSERAHCMQARQFVE